MAVKVRRHKRIWRNDKKYHGEPTWANTFTKEQISVHGTFGKSPYHVMYNSNRLLAPSSSHTIRVFDKKKEAILFAKRFMKRHRKKQY